MLAHDSACPKNYAYPIQYLNINILQDLFRCFDPPPNPAMYCCWKASPH